MAIVGGASSGRNQKPPPPPYKWVLQDKIAKKDQALLAKQ